MNNHKIYYSIMLILLVIFYTSCNSEVDVKQDYDFTVTMQKYRKEISQGDTKELEFFIQKEGDYKNSKYYASVFLRSGTGKITIDNNAINENTFYEVSNTGFKIQYTSLSKESHQIEVIVKNSFGQEKETIISLSNK